MRDVSLLLLLLLLVLVFGCGTDVQYGADLGLCGNSSIVRGAINQRRIKKRSDTAISPLNSL